MKKLIIISTVCIIILMSATSCMYELMEGDVLRVNVNESEEWGMLRSFYEDGLWGFKDIYGEVIVEPQYLHIYRFSEGLAFVRGVEGREYQTGFIDTTGTLVIPLPTAFTTGSFSEGFANIRKWDETWGMVEDPRVPASIGSGGYAMFIDKTGKDVFGQKFASASPFSEGLAFVRGMEGSEYMTGFIDAAGELVIPLPDAIVGGSFSGGFALIIEREWDWGIEHPQPGDSIGPLIFIDRTGQNVFGQEFEIASPFSDGIALVALYGGNYFFIDHTGQNVFGQEFDLASTFWDGYASVTLLDGRQGYINRRGNFTDRRP